MPSTKARAFWISKPWHGEIRSETIEPPGPGEVAVRTLYSGVSRGTESLVFTGRVPASEYERMRAPFQAGEFPGPVKYGYINVGIVEQGEPEWLGKKVFCLYPHQTRYVVPAAGVYALPDGVPPRRAVLAANLETALNGLWDTEPRAGRRITVIGAGAVGCLCAWLAQKLAGADVEIIDIDPAKQALASRLGLRFAMPDAASAGAETLIHASGAPEGLRTALQLAGFEATIVELSWYGDRLVSLPLGEAFHSKRLMLRSSQVGTVARAKRAEWSPRRRMEYALDLLADPALDVLVGGDSAFDELPELMLRLSSAQGAAACHRITYS